MEQSRTMKQYWILILLTLSPSIYAADISQLVKKAPYNNAKISPDGKHIALTAYNGDRYGLYFLNSDTLERVGSFFNSGRSQVGDFFWGNNSRVVIRLAIKPPWEKKLYFTGELYAVDIDGGDPELIYGFRAGSEKQNRGKVIRKHSTEGWANILDLLPQEKRLILISSTNELSKPMLIDIYNGRVRKRFKSVPIPSARILTNKSGKVVFAAAMDENENRRLFHYDYEENDWTEILNRPVGDHFTPFSLTDDQNGVFALDDIDGDRLGLYKFDLNSDKYEQLYKHDLVDITSIERTIDGNHVYSVRVDNGLPEYIPLEKDQAEAKLFAGFLKKFPGYKLNITSRSLNGNKLVLSISSDTIAGVYFLFDKTNESYRMLFTKTPYLNDTPLARKQPFTFTASDKTKVSGYYTKALKGKNDSTISPLVVLVHGGPHGVRDYWGFDSQVQALATNGYSVLQVNYRGSFGYGNQFAQIGYEHWGDTIQQDIIDATQWAIQKGLAQKKRVCIMGGSFGAYSAVQSSILSPELFQCAIATAGIYDLSLLGEEGDIQYLYFAQSFLERVLGTDKKKIAAMSPVNNVSKLKTPLFLIHGEKDRRAPIIHAEKLIRELKNHHKTYQWLEIDDEAHGFYDSHNQEIYLKKVLEFLHKYNPL